ncbi:MAG: isoprenylcysteine carboxyl methyltransferase family protein [Candidatus Kapaibacterium sp.]
MPENVTLLSLIQWSPLQILILLTILQRIAELRTAKRNERGLRGRGAVEFGRDHYPAIVTMHTFWFIVMIAEIVLLSRPVNPFWPVLLPIWLGAQGLRYWTLRTLGERWTTRVLVVPGEKPVTGGPFNYLRHPNYLAVVVEILLLPLIFSCYITAIVFSLINAVLLWIRIRAEERGWREVGGS